MSLKRFVVLGCVSVLSLSACTAKEDIVDPLTVDRPAAQIYKDAAVAESKKELKKAKVLYSEIERQHPYSDYATQAQLRMAELSYQGLQYDDALMSLDKFIETHPGHPKVDYALYLKAMCYYEQITDVGRDQAMTENAMQALDAIVSRFPDSKYARDSKLKLDLVHDHLAGKEMEVGRYYMKQEQYSAAVNRFMTVVRDYQTTTHVPEALHRLVESYMILGLKDEATRVAAVLGHNYPGSQWYQDTYNVLEPLQRAKLKDTRTWVNRKVSDLLKPN